MRHQAQQAAERAQRFGDPLVGLEEAEDADQRRGLVQPQLVAEAVAVGLRNPGAVRDHGGGTGEAGGAHLVPHEAAVHHHAARRLQNAPRHRHAFVVRAHFQLADALGECQRRGAAVVFALAHVGVPIAALDGEVGDQVVQVAFVHHHHAGMPQRGLVDETVMAVVAHVVERDIEARRVERLVRAGEHFQVHQRLQAVDQGFGIIGDPAARRRQRGEERHAHFQRTSSSETVPMLTGILISSGVRAASRA